MNTSILKTQQSWCLMLNFGLYAYVFRCGCCPRGPSATSDEHSEWIFSKQSNIKTLMPNKHSHHKCASYHCKFCGKRTPERSLETRRRCRFCKKEMARTHVYTHEQYHCPKNPNRKKRSYKTVACPICGKAVHEKYLSKHVQSQHHSRSKKSSKKWMCSKSSFVIFVSKGVSQGLYLVSKVVRQHLKFGTYA